MYNIDFGFKQQSNYYIGFMLHHLENLMCTLRIQKRLKAFLVPPYEAERAYRFSFGTPIFTLDL